MDNFYNSDKKSTPYHMIYDNNYLSLVHGIRDKGNRTIKRVNLRTIDGYDEDFLNRLESKNLPYPIKMNILLSRVVKFASNDKSNEKHILHNVRNMTIGDRAYLVFLVRQSMYGNSIYFDVMCDSCQKTMSIHLRVNQVLANSFSDQNKPNVVIQKVEAHYRLKFSDCVIEFRLLTGLVQEKLLLDNMNDMELLQSCILNMDPIIQEKLDGTNFVNLLSSVLSHLDPLSDIVLTQHCPSCNIATKIPFIIEDYLFKEIRSRRNNLEWEVHWLALNYHWSESEILKLPIDKRRRYVELINNTLGGEVTVG